MITVYHNSRCGKSRDALKYLEDRNIPYKVVEYLKDTPDEKMLQSRLKKLNMKPHDLIRTKEAIYIENYKGKMLNPSVFVYLVKVVYIDNYTDKLFKGSVTLVR